MSKQQIIVMNYFQQGDFTLKIAAICTQNIIFKHIIAVIITNLVFFVIKDSFNLNLLS